MAKRSRSAVAVGILFILATLFFMIGDSIYGPILRSDDYLDRAFPERTTVVVGVLIGLVGVLAIPLIATFMFPIFRRENEAWAQSYVALRVMEALLLTIVSAGTLSVVSLSEAYLAGGGGAPALSGAATALHALGEWAHILSVGIVFPFAAIVLYSLLLRMKLVPRWIAHWGLWAAVLLLGGTLLDQLGFLSGAPDTLVELVLAGPIAVNEMVLAVWLIAKGFNEHEESHASAAV
jgi:hypothetical protein